MAKTTERTYVKYTALPGIVSERSISKADWANIGIDHDDVVFNRGNRFQVDATDFTEEVMEYFRGDDDFSVTTKDSPPALADKGSLENLDGGVSGGSGLTGGATVGGGSTASSATGTTGTTGT